MSNCTLPHHENHDHIHGAGCGHIAVKHSDHIDYLHDGHLHHPHGDHVDEHIIEVSTVNPDGCHPITTMKLCHTAITLIIWLMVACITRMVITVMITGLWKSFKLKYVVTKFHS